MGAQAILVQGILIRPQPTTTYRYPFSRRAMSASRVAIALVSAASVASASTDAGSSALFKRECDMVCDHVSDWYESIGAAQEACAVSRACAAVVDHSATHGQFGLCGSDSIISKGSDRSETLRAVCVEHKREIASGNSVALLQMSAGTSAAASEAAVAKMFTRQCDMVCDGSDFHNSLFAAQHACAGDADCVGIVDHSINRGRFGICKTGAAFATGSSKSEAFRGVCVERKNV